MKISAPKYTTTARVVRELGISASLLRKLARNGHLHPAKFGPPNLDKFGRDRRMTLYPVSELNDLIEGNIAFGSPRLTPAW